MIKLFPKLDLTSLLPYVAVGLLFLIYIWPLTNYKANIAGYVPGDPYAHAGQAVWFCEAFATNNYFQANYFAPMGIDMSASFDAPIINLLLCPLRTLGPAFMLNAMAVIQVGLILVISYLFIRRYVSSRILSAGFVFLYGFSTYYMVRATHHVTLLSTIWVLPLVWWALDEIDFKSLLRSLLAGVVVGICFVSAWQNIPNLALLIVVKGVAVWWRSKPIKLHEIFIHGCVFVLGVLWLSLPFILPPFISVSTAGQIEDIKGNRMFNADVASYMIPWREHMFFPWFRQVYTSIVNSERAGYYEQFVAFDPITLFLIGWMIVGYLKKKFNFNLEDKIMLVLGGLYFILSLGPYLTIGGWYLSELPYFSLLSKMLPFSITRTPARYGLVSVFFITVVVFKKLDKSLAKSKNRYRQRIVWGILGLSILWTTIGMRNIQYPTTNYTEDIPLHGMKVIADDNRDVMVWHIPYGMGSDPSQNFMQSLHGKPASSAYVSRTALHDPFLKMLMNNDVIPYLECEGGIIASKSKLLLSQLPELFVDESKFIDRMKLNRVGYVVVNRYNLDFPQCTYVKAWTDQYFRRFSQLMLVDSTNTHEVYRID